MATNIFDAAKAFLYERAMGWAEDFICRLPLAKRQAADTYLLSAIFLQLKELTEAVRFGGTRYDIKPFLLGTVPQKILEKEPSGRVRKVSLWIDSAVGGPTPTIRVSKSDSSYNSGGHRVNAGVMNDLGEVPPDLELYGVSSTNIQAYIVERV